MIPFQTNFPVIYIRPTPLYLLTRYSPQSTTHITPSENHLPLPSFQPFGNSKSSQNSINSPLLSFPSFPFYFRFVAASLHSLKDKKEGRSSIARGSPVNSNYAYTSSATAKTTIFSFAQETRNRSGDVLAWSLLSEKVERMLNNRYNGGHHHSSRHSYSNYLVIMSRGRHHVDNHALPPQMEIGTYGRLAHSFLDVIFHSCRVKH